MGFMRRRAGFVTVGILWGAIVLEVGIRLLLPPIQDRIFEGDPVLGWRHVRGTEVRFVAKEFDNVVRLNSQGLVDDEYPFDKPPGTVRILVLGDSYAESLQAPLDRAYHGLLESRLNRLSDTVHYEVINAGVSAYGTDQELLYYRAEGYRYEPDLVLLLFTPNDVQDIVEHDFFRLDGDGRLVDSKRPSGRGPLLGFRMREAAYDLSQAYRYGLLAYKQLLEADYYDPRFNYVEPLSDEMTQGWQRAEALLRALAAEAEYSGARFAVVYVAAREQMEGRHWSDIAGAVGGHSPGWNIDSPNEHLAHIASAAAIPFLDLTEAFRTAHKAGGDELFFTFDIHWTEAGHAVAAEQLYEFLRAESLLVK